MSITTDTILLQPIQKMDVSRAFKVMAKANQFKTLADILDSPVPELPLRTYSSYRILKEFLTLLEDAGLANLVYDREAT